MTPTWKQYEGQAVDGIALLQLLGSGDSSAVFLGDRSGERCAVKLIPTEGVVPQVHLARWEEASKLSHPHLSRILQWGAGRLGGFSLVYVAMEFAEEDLSSVDRPLTPKEARETLTSIVESLAYLHGKGFVHGRIKPSNVLSVGEELKISGDAPLRKGDRSAASSAEKAYDPPEFATAGATPAGDVWSLGVVLVEALTKELPVLEGGSVRLPDSLKPASFRDVAAGCLEPEPARRWTVSDLSQWLERGTVPAPKRVSPKYLIPALAAAGVIVAGAAIWTYVVPSSTSQLAEQASTNTTSQPPAQDRDVATGTKGPVKAPPLPKREFTPGPEGIVSDQPQAPARKPVEAKPEVKSPAKIETHPEVPQSAVPAPPEAPPAASRDAAVAFPDVAQSVLPDVPAKAVSTIHGKVPITVRVQTDASGAVTSATVESGKSSQYFAELALKAARQWKFVPGADGRAWTLRFEFTHNTPHPVTAQVTPSR
jgi:TonB family protein